MIDFFRKEFFSLSSSDRFVDVIARLRTHSHTIIIYYARTRGRYYYGRDGVRIKKKNTAKTKYLFSRLYILFGGDCFFCGVIFLYTRRRCHAKISRALFRHFTADILYIYMSYYKACTVPFSGCTREIKKLRGRRVIITRARARAYVCIGHGAGQRVAKLPIGFLIHGAAMLLVSDDFYTCKPFFFLILSSFFPIFFVRSRVPPPWNDYCRLHLYVTHRTPAIPCNYISKTAVAVYRDNSLARLTRIVNKNAL